LCENICSALESLSRFADSDSQAFQEYVRARSLPRTTEEEKLSRSAAMEVAILRATHIPLASARNILEALEYVESAMKLADLHLLSDVFGGAILMQAALKAVLLNVGVNVLLLSDREMRANLEAERAELEALLADRNEAIALAYQARIADSKEFAGITD
jgi:formiminotetrahydrofolate cyclodeaminase